MDDILGLLVTESREDETLDRISDSFDDLSERIRAVHLDREAGEVEDEETLDRMLLEDHMFKRYLFMQLPLIVRRSRDLTNEDGVLVDPEFVIEAIERSIVSISPSLFSDIEIPYTIKRNLFEERPYDIEKEGERTLVGGLQEKGFEFSIDWTDDLGTAHELLEWAEDKLVRFVEERTRTDSRLYEIYVSYLVMSYLFHRRLYEEMGVDSLEKFWTEYSMKRRQGEAFRSAKETGWTVRETAFLDPKKEEGGVIHAVLEPPAARIPRRRRSPDRTLRIGVRRWTAYVKGVGAKMEVFLNTRRNWISDPSWSEDKAGVGKPELQRMKDDVFSSLEVANGGLKGIKAIDSNEAYSIKPEFKVVVELHKALRIKIADEFSGGMTSLDQSLPLVSDARTIDGEMKEIERRFVEERE